MQKGCYFPSRHHIIDWINDALHTDLTNIEQLGSGNIYCHLLDAAYPGKVPLQKVKWKATLQVDFIHNFKILQNSFEHLGIDKLLQVEKLVKAKYQDNLELIQWVISELGQQIDQNHTYYHPLSRRHYADIHLIACGLKHSRSSTQLTLHNKQNCSNQNRVLTPRGHPLSRKHSFSDLKPLTPRTSNEQTKPLRESKKGIFVTSRGGSCSSFRVKTEACPLMLVDIAAEQILEEDQECF